jgi:hypothetical protein
MNHPLYKRLYRQHLTNLKEIKYDVEHAEGLSVAVVPAKHDAETAQVKAAQESLEQAKKTDEDELIWKRRRVCDDIFTEYLDFVAKKVKKESGQLSTMDSIDLIQNVCHWLFINGYTCSKLSLIQ